MSLQIPCSLQARRRRHCEEQGDEAIQNSLAQGLDCFAALAMTRRANQLWLGDLLLGRFHMPAVDARIGAVDEVKIVITAHALLHDEPQALPALRIAQ
jgi:hypothetical protein